MFESEPPEAQIIAILLKTGEALLLRVGGVLLAVELFCLQLSMFAYTG